MVQWDENKRIRNLAEKGLDFKDAEEALEQGFIDGEAQVVKGDIRFRATIRYKGRITKLVYQIRRGDLRIIGWRYANHRERKAFSSSTNKGR